MRNRLFYVPVERMVEFVEILEENELESTIQGTEDNEIAISVSYERDDREIILDLMEMIDVAEEDDDNDD